MRPRFRASLIALALLALPAMAAPSSGKVARVLDIDGNALLTDKRTSNRWFQAYRGMDSYLKERMRTDAKTQATLSFFIGGQAGIAPGSEIVIIGQRDIDVVGNQVELTAGKMWAKFDKQKSQLQIKTSGGVIGIEGTELLVSVEEGSPVSEVMLFEGRIQLTDNEGNTQTLHPGDYAEFGGGGGGPCVLSYPSNGLRSLVVERFPEFSSFLAARGLTSIPTNSTVAIGRSHNPARPDIEDLLTVSQTGLVMDPQGLEATGQGQPLFRWPASGGADSYLLVLASDAKMEDIAFSTYADGANFQVPSGAPGAPAGTYHLRVIPLGPDGQPASPAMQTSFESDGWQSEGVLGQITP